MIKVSIIMPTYNQESRITRALDSIPDRDDLEVLVINDGSTDNTWDVLSNYKRFEKTQLRLFKNETNKGSGLSRNVGFDNATGKWLYALDSDDYFYTNEFVRVIDNLDKLEDFDIVHVHLQTNDGTYWRYAGLCGFPTYFVKREFFGNTRCAAINRSEDRRVLMELRTRGPKEVTISEPVFYHYDYPREGSISWNFEHRSGKW